MELSFHLGDCLVSIDKVKLSVIKYATENEHKVKTAMLQCLPDDFRKRKSLQFKKTSLIGQYGEPIIMLELTEAKGASQVLSHIFSYLTETEKKRLLNEFNARFDYDTNTFHFRLDKFAPLGEELYLADGSDVIKVEVKMKTYQKLDHQQLTDFLKTFMVSVEKRQGD